ncbi:glycosyl transferase [Streptomyces sp. CB02923]|uniref:glycosyltransferase n=1 Tax=Streptomyces sp. CB02923 TaxID=1718985 RepID=UPI00093F524C|nr:glycosyltransferase [Streptomyces sp. CB02923]OKI08121.1 glycosyl transferase [Streptomyces sp. CB02923]
MRVLCTATGSPSHGRALLPLARALAGAGHDVTVATTTDVASVFAADAVTVEPCLPRLDFGTDQQEDTGDATGTDAGAAQGQGEESGQESDQSQGEESGQEQHLRVLIERLTGDMAIESHRVLAELARTVRPDAIIRDGMDVAACLLAEQLGVPQLPIPAGTVNVLDPALLLPALNRLREQLGLPVQESPGSLYPHGRFDYLPAAYSFARFPAKVLAYRQTTVVDRTAGLPGWVAELPTDRPLVFAAVGTALPMFREVLPEGAPLPVGMTDPAEQLGIIIAGLNRLDCTAVVATGGIEPAGAEPAPHVHLTDRLAQPLLLECADLFLTHGGYNSIREALRTGTPMAVLPNFGDQPPNAERVQELGLGRHLTDTSPEAVAAVCQEILDDRGIAARVRKAQLASLALPDVGQVVDDLEKLVA